VNVDVALLVEVWQRVDLGRKHQLAEDFSRQQVGQRKRSVG
jgi:hypothetical protein